MSAFDDLPPQLQTAARWLLDHRDDVAFLSMREVARRAAVAPATMTRLAQRLGYDGFGGLRELFADAVRARAVPFRERAEGLTARRDLDGDSALFADTLAVISAHLRALSEPETQAAIVQAADILQQCERAYWVGARSGFAPMHLGAYLLSLIGENASSIWLAASVSMPCGPDVGRCSVALTIAPYTVTTVEAVAFAEERGARVIALTDSRTSPIARNASVTPSCPPRRRRSCTR